MHQFHFGQLSAASSEREQDQAGLRTQPETTPVPITSEIPGRVILKDIQQSNAKKTGEKKKKEIVMA